jgi:hypothetical protein
MNETAREKKIADALVPVLLDKDAFIVRQDLGHIRVHRLPGHVLRETHPRLYGHLLSVNEQLATGCGIYLLGMLAAALICIGLALGWWDELIGKDIADDLRSLWLYQFVFVLGIGIPGCIAELRARARYRALRSELLATMEMENFDRDVLVATIQHDQDVAVVARHLKLDREIPHRSEPGS